MSRALFLVGCLLCVISSSALGQSTVRPTHVAMPAYPLMLRASFIEGVVRFEAPVTAFGRIDTTSVRVVESSHEGFLVALKRTLPEWRFSPQRPHTQGKRVVNHIV